jgi:hypothetical protein
MAVTKFGVADARHTHAARHQARRGMQSAQPRGRSSSRFKAGVAGGLGCAHAGLSHRDESSLIRLHAELARTDIPPPESRLVGSCVESRSALNGNGRVGRDVSRRRLLGEHLRSTKP